jgi:hypothetical protein
LEVKAVRSAAGGAVARQLKESSTTDLRLLQGDFAALATTAAADRAWVPKAFAIIFLTRNNYCR